MLHEAFPMGLLETEETNKFTYEAFAAHPFYTDVNRSLVKQALGHLETRPADVPLTIVDMACGTGAITRLIAEEVAAKGRQAHLIGVDPSGDALRSAHKSMEEMAVQADFIHGEAEERPTLVQGADVRFFFNAIH